MYSVKRSSVCSLGIYFLYLCRVGVVSAWSFRRQGSGKSIHSYGRGEHLSGDLLLYSFIRSKQWPSVLLTVDVASQFKAAFLKQWAASGTREARWAFTFRIKMIWGGGGVDGRLTDIRLTDVRLTLSSSHDFRSLPFSPLLRMDVRVFSLHSSLLLSSRLHSPVLLPASPS